MKLICRSPLKLADNNREAAESYLESDMFINDIVGELGPLLNADPEVRIYEAS